MKTLNERIKIYAEAFGSKAATITGQARAVKKEMNQETSKYNDTWVKALLKSTIRSALQEEPRTPRPKFTPDEADVRHANACPAWRKLYLRRLRNAEKKLMAPPALEVDAITAWAEDDERIKNHNRINRLLLAIGATPKCDRPTRKDRRTIFIDDYRGAFYELAKKRGYRGSRRGDNYHVRPTIRNSHWEHEDPVCEYKAGKGWRTLSHAVNDNYIRSFAIILSPSTIQLAFHDLKKNVTLPDGYQWGSDSEGLYAKRNGDDYHPSATDLLKFDPAGYIVAEIAKNAEKRKQIAAEMMAQGYDISGLYVCLRDSMRAGNCEAGSRQWAQKNGFDASRHYLASLLLRVASFDSLQRVKIACMAAYKQQKMDIERGYSVISEHRA